MFPPTQTQPAQTGKPSSLSPKTQTLLRRALKDFEREDLTLLSRYQAWIKNQLRNRTRVLKRLGRQVPGRAGKGAECLPGRQRLQRLQLGSIQLGNSR